VVAVLEPQLYALLRFVRIAKIKPTASAPVPCRALWQHRMWSNKHWTVELEQNVYSWSIYNLRRS
jgi:hypothetical protein